MGLFYVDEYATSRTMSVCIYGGYTMLVLAAVLFVLWLVGFGLTWGFCDAQDAEGWQAIAYIVLGIFSFIVIPLMAGMILCFVIGRAGFKIGCVIEDNIDRFINW